MLKKILFGSLVATSLIIVAGYTAETENNTTGKCGQGKCDNAKKIKPKTETSKYVSGKSEE